MIKRLVDIIVILLGALFIIPILIITLFLVKIKLSSPIFFLQSRVGRNGRLFNIVKFRTMTYECNEDGIISSDEVRLTEFGKFLRSTSLDELPGLWNVLRGDMSLVGPRPLLVEYLPLYSAEQARRHEVKPGVTGWAQVNGRNAINWEEKFDLDVWYVDHQSMWLDIKILWLTVKKVITRDGISAQGDITMPMFKGTK
jgi:lipopolysaccharide/colanic/teichoic acid biosynthesis glycosyltransferase